NPKPRLARAKVDDPPPVRHSLPKETAPARITLPSPEELGVSSARAPSESFDWSPIQRRFREAGASCFHVEFQPEGRCNLICLVPSDRPDRTHRIDAEGSSEEETARLAVQKLDEWHAARTK